MRHLKIIVTVILFSLMLSGFTYGEEPADNKIVPDYEALSKELTSDDKEVREEAIDKLMAGVTGKLERAFMKYEWDETGEYKKYDDKVRKAMMEAFAIVSLEETEDIRKDISEMLDDDNTRKLITPFMPVCLEIINDKIDEQIEEVLNKNNGEEVKEETTEEDLEEDK